jgi:hypothetical protein
MFFTRGLLHWVTKSRSYVPDDVNLMLLGSDLPDYEQEWIRKTIRRPFHNIGMRINDKLAWTFLFDVNEYSFGWLDIDCLVLNGDLFAEMSAIADSNSVNGVWWHDTGSGFGLSATSLASRVGSYVLNSSFHLPLWMAQDAAIVDEFTGGRLQLGRGSPGCADAADYYSTRRTAAVGERAAQRAGRNAPAAAMTSPARASRKSSTGP